MIAMIAPAVFNHQKHERYTVNFDTIGGYSRKYSVITVPHQNVTAQEVSEMLENLQSLPVLGKVDFVLKGKAGEELELTRAFGDYVKTVKTGYKVNRDIDGHGVMHYQSFLKSSGVVFVCHL